MKQQSLKKAFFSIAAIAALFSIGSCEKSDQKDETVSVYLTYTITTDNGQEMRGTKASSAEVFDEFYQKIKSGELVAPQYNLTFTEKTTGAVYTVDGTWAGKDMVTLRTGTYKVVGTSTATGENIQDKCSLKFDDEVTVDVSSKTITLKAAYDCSLIIFSDASISKLSNFNGISSTDLFKFSSYIYAFVHTTLYAEGHKADSYLEGTHTNTTKFKIYTGNLNYEIGKFYVYNDISTSFALEKMEEGDDESGPYYIEKGINYGKGINIDGIVWAPVNCGYEAATETSKGFVYGKLFQWGRKDGQGYGEPYSFDTPETQYYSDAALPKIAEKWTGKPENADANTFYYGTTSSDEYDWISPQNDKLWNSGTEESPIKTQYDPCPTGWRVPTCSELKVLFEGNFSDITLYKGVTGWWCTGSKTYSPELHNKIFLPAAGFRFGDEWFHSAGCAGRGECASVWSSTTTSVHAFGGSKDTNINIIKDPRGAGQSVRCVVE